MTSVTPVQHYGMTRFIVDATVANGSYTTIQSAITAASSGTDIFINPGTYTENLTLKAGVNLVGFKGDEGTPQVTIIGTCTFTAAGTLTISNIRLQTNSAFVVAVTGSAASVLVLENCYLNITNNTAISFTSSNSSAIVSLVDCMGAIFAIGITIFTSSSAGLLSFNRCTLSNVGPSVTASTISAGILQCVNSSFLNPITSSGTCVTLLTSTSFSGLSNTISFTHNSTAAGCIASYCSFTSGTASAISVGTGATLIANEIIVSSSNANIISGAGTINYGIVVGQQNTGTISATQTTNRIFTGTLFSTGISFNGGTNTLNTLPVPVTQGGTGLATTTAYGIITGGTTATGNFQNAGTGAATSTVLIGNGSAALPSFSATPQLTGLGIGAASTGTGLTFDGTNTLANYAVLPFTPTAVGGSTAGTTTYSGQNGYYTRIGNQVTVWAYIAISAATGTGAITLGGLPFTIKNQTNYFPAGSVLLSLGALITFPVGTTYPTVSGNSNTTTAIIYCSGSGSAGGTLQMANSTATIEYTLTYQI